MGLDITICVTLTLIHPSCCLRTLAPQTFTDFSQTSSHLHTHVTSTKMSTASEDTSSADRVDAAAPLPQPRGAACLVAVGRQLRVQIRWKQVDAHHVHGHVVVLVSRLVASSCSLIQRPIQICDHTRRARRHQWVHTLLRHSIHAAVAATAHAQVSQGLQAESGGWGAQRQAATDDDAQRARSTLRWRRRDGPSACGSSDLSTPRAGRHPPWLSAPQALAATRDDGLEASGLACLVGAPDMYMCMEIMIRSTPSAISQTISWIHPASELPSRSTSASRKGFRGGGEVSTAGASKPCRGFPAEDTMSSTDSPARSVCGSARQCGASSHSDAS